MKAVMSTCIPGLSQIIRMPCTLLSAFVDNASQLAERAPGTMDFVGAERVIYLAGFPGQDNHNRPYIPAELAAHLKQVTESLGLPR